MRRLKIGLAIALGAFLSGVYVTFILTTAGGFLSIIPLGMIAYVAVLLYLNSRLKVGDVSSGGIEQKSLPPHCAPLKIFASGMGLLFAGVLLLLLAAVGLLVLSGGVIE